MPPATVAAAAAAHNGFSHADSTSSFQRYEQHISGPTVPILRRDRNAASSPPFLTHLHPSQPRTRGNGASSHPRLSGAGAEPGVHPHQESSISKYSHFKQDCVVDVIDYNSDDVTVERLGNADFIKMINDSYAKETNSESDHHPKAVRWINIGGLDWDILSSLTLRYHVHSLALEDVLQEQGHIQSKVDYYPDHLFLRILCHSVCPPDECEDHVHLGHPYHYGPQQHEAGIAPPAYNVATGGDLESDPRPPTSSSTAPLNSQQPPPKPKSHLNVPLLRSLDLRTRFMGLKQSNDQRQMMKLRALTAEDHINTTHEPMHIFLFHDGTVISIMPTTDLDFTAPITERLHHSQSVLRTSEDASLLIEALLDLAVDRILEVINEYQIKIHKLEHDIMLHPRMNSVRSLHILSGDLIMHKLTLEPIKTMIYNLRRYDVDRCIAMANQLKAEAEASPSDSYSHNSDSDSDATVEMASPGSNKNNGKQKERQTYPHGRHAPISDPTAFEYQFGFGLPENVTPADVASTISAPGPIPSSSDVNIIGGRMRKRVRRRQARGGQKQREAEREERMRWEHWQRVQAPYQRCAAIQVTASGVKVKGYLSYTCKVYLGDVYDHIDFALTSLDMFAGISENLIDYAFNMASYEMNQVMSRLTLVTIIFLPPTLLTGYFGMNFEPFKSIEGHSEFLFWRVVLPAMAILIPLFMSHDLRNLSKYVSRKWRSGQAVKGMW
ncbi:hypothetical protein P691DRAFT_733595 [Macrolepiota fuliginosa MF-IS2]|uniref:Uncharacterized protein n=1 Tax=Macrolepiota fuliginosa MF-IS2 TaxID=1400762 RepID=A0A9P5X871_9AGAR|nr:hypothetical protein P691DRAFT_733595 [Macrolepiota fuliginosa MF-IS2]